MRVLALTRYGRKGASSRLRFYQYLPTLEADGIHVEIAPLFSDTYVQNLQAGQRSVLEVAKAYVRRVIYMLRAGDFDLLWVEKELLPWLPSWLEKALLVGNLPFVLDYDDAVFHTYDQHSNSWVRKFLSGKHPDLMQRAEVIVVGNDYLADFARVSGAPNVETVPTVIDLERYSSTNNLQLKSENKPCVGWIGQRATAAFLTPLTSIFQRLSEDGVASFTAVGIQASSFDLPMASIPWTEDTEVQSIRGFDIGIMPLLDEPFERGKCGYKLIQYMACGLPIVASPVGVNSQIIEHGVNGFLAETPLEWEMALRTLVSDPAMRIRMGQAGRQKVEQQYCLQVTATRLMKLLRGAVDA